MGLHYVPFAKASKYPGVYQQGVHWGGKELWQVTLANIKWNGKFVNHLVFSWILKCRHFTFEARSLDKFEKDNR
jgi:hypothetical protein